MEYVFGERKKPSGVASAANKLPFAKCPRFPRLSDEQTTWGTNLGVERNHREII